MSLRDDLRSAAKVTELLGGGLALTGALTGNKTLTGIGAAALVGGMIADGGGLSSRVLGLHSWRDNRLDLFNRRVDMWHSRGRWGHHAHYGLQHYMAQKMLENIIATPGFFGERTSR